MTTHKNKVPLVVNIYGGPGSGKSTTAAGVFSMLKLHDVDCELVTEFAKDLVWEERHKTFENQRLIFGEQYNRLWRLVGKVDVVITDCPLILNIVYKPIQYKNNFCNDVLDAINEFVNLNIILKRVKKFNPNGRIQNEDVSKMIDCHITQLLDKYKMDWTEFTGDEDGINKTTSKILSIFEKKHVVLLSKKER
jgi:adenylate kinase family enzyme